MRKYGITAVALVAILAFTAVALAAQTNKYGVTAKTSPTNAGTKKKPAPLGLNFDYTVDEVAGQRPALVTSYKIHFGGLAVNTDLFKTCAAADITANQSDADCPPDSLVGIGNVENAAGSTTNPADRSVACHLDLKIYNSGKNKAALFLKGGPNAANPAKACPLTIAEAIPAKFVKDSKGTALVFTVNAHLLNPAPGVDNAVIQVASSIKKKIKTVKGVKHGFFESTGGCTGGKRTVTVTFTTAAGNGVQSATTPCKK